MLLCNTYIIVALEMSYAMFLEFIMCTVQTNLGSLRKKIFFFRSN